MNIRMKSDSEYVYAVSFTPLEQFRSVHLLLLTGATDLSFRLSEFIEFRKGDFRKLLSWVEGKGFVRNDSCGL
jgi:hypothetical protein